MPGFNQRGPMNEGPMTGRGRGVCTGNMTLNQGSAQAGFPMRMGRGLGRRGCQAPGWQGGQGGGRGYGPWAGPAPVASSQAILQARADRLEAELADIKNQLNNQAESGE
ncbi:MAG: DUF5320 domain-containing protein [Pseudomonadota bacterium]